MITLQADEDSKYVYIPQGLDKGYLEGVLARSLGREITILNCRTTNLCADLGERVSHSGSTVLHLALELKGEQDLDIVLKILAPDIINPFKGDPDFESRVLEIRWAEWWGRQPVSWVPVTYDTRCHLRSREFWIIQEYFPQIGWHGLPEGRADGEGRFRPDPAQWRLLFRQMALLHAHSARNIDELLRLFPEPWDHRMLPDRIEEMLSDPDRLALLKATAEERSTLEACRHGVRQRPPWADDWPPVCVTRDWKAANFGVRDPGNGEELVIFDWGAAVLEPLESDIEVLPRFYDIDDSTIAEYLPHYVQTYAEQTGRELTVDTVMRRLPWMRLFKTLACIVSWDLKQPGSHDFVKMLIGLCQRTLNKLDFE
jgi:hypothetical protein